MKHLLMTITLAMCGLTLAAQTEKEREVTLSADSIITPDRRVDSLYRTLPEVMVMGERPLVKAKASKLIYDLPRMIARMPIDNAYEALKQLPGIVEMNGSLTLSGQGVAILIDGKVNNISSEQLYTLLRSIPAGRIERAEVMYNAPARYGVRGAAIDLHLKKADADTPSCFQGEAYAKYEYDNRPHYEQRASFNFNHKRYSTDFLYRHTHGKDYQESEKEAIHTLANGTQHHIRTWDNSQSRSYRHSLRWGNEYEFGKDHRLSFVYNGTYSSGNSQAEGGGDIVSSTKKNTTSWLHNGQLNYRLPFGLELGAEMTYYNTPSEQTQYSKDAQTTLHFLTGSGQRINRWNFFAKQLHTFSKGWELNCGVIYNTTIDHSYQWYKKQADNTVLPQPLDSRRREETFNSYAGFSKEFGKKFSLEMSLAAEHYRTERWNEWNIYPTLNASFRPSQEHMFQFAFNSSSSYPSYWATQNAVSYSSSGYSEIHGNPLLKPSRSYENSLTYILKNKYIFRAWFEHIDDYAMQTVYQLPDRLKEVYRYMNFDFKQSIGVMANFPIKWWKQANTRITAIGGWTREKDSDFHDISFDRQKLYCFLSLNNTFTLSRRPDITMQCNGYFNSGSIQGTYDLPASGSLDASLRYRFAKQKATLRLFCNDIFNTSGISPRVRMNNQWITNRWSYYTQVGVSFSYTFGGYKEKQREGVDTSRFR